MTPRIAITLAGLFLAAVAFVCCKATPQPAPVKEPPPTVCPCPNCLGSGIVVYDGSDPALGEGSFTCPMCRGDGELIEERPRPVKQCTNPACKCDPCECEPCNCKAPEPLVPPRLRAYVVAQCKTPGCVKHPFTTELARLSAWGNRITILAANVPADAEQIAALDVPADSYPYVVIEADGETYRVKSFPKDADEIANWLNEQAALSGGVWVETVGASNLCSAVVVTSETCPPCKALKRDQATIEAELGAALEFSGDAKQYAVRSYPTTIILMGGKEVAREVGYDKRTYVARLRELAKNAGGRWK